MLRLSLILLHAMRVAVRLRVDLVLENLALRHQVAVLKDGSPRPRLSNADRLFWVLLPRLWSRWADVLYIVQPETVARWHRAGLGAFWPWNSRPKRPGRPRVDREIRCLIRRMARESGTWGAPHIHAELLKLGLVVSERTVPFRPRSRFRTRSFHRSHRSLLGQACRMPRQMIGEPV